MVCVFYTKFKERLSEELFKEYLAVLPRCLKEKTLKYRRWEDAQAHLFGKLLLIEGLRKIGVTNPDLKDLTYTQFSRPFYNSKMDFNISHSGEYVICAIGENVQIGVDIEKIGEIEFAHYRDIMSDEQWNEINESVNPTRTFYKYWSMIESVIKADGRGFFAISKVRLNDDSCAFCDDQKWFLKELKFDWDYSAYIASNVKNMPIDFFPIDFYSTENF